MEPIREFGSNDSITGVLMRCITRAIIELQKFAFWKVQPPLWVRQGTLGITIPGSSPIIGKIAATGPLGSESDYTDARYWVNLEKVTSDDSTHAAAITFADVSWTPPPPKVVTATNLAEFTAGTHALSAGAIVEVHSIQDAGGNLQYVFTAGGAGGSSTIPVALSGGSGGVYTGREQAWSSGAWSEKSGATALTCVNLCETTGGHTSAVDGGAIVMATKSGDTYFFNWPTNAKYKA